MPKKVFTILYPGRIDYEGNAFRKSIKDASKIRILSIEYSIIQIGFDSVMEDNYVIASCSNCGISIERCSKCGELFKPGDKIDCNYLVDKHSHVTCNNKNE